MKIAVLSGKGGTGKTFLSVNLSVAAAKNADCVYIDCDVEEPNGNLFFKSKNEKEFPVNINVPEFDFDKCTGCRKCVSFCAFNALAFVKHKPYILEELCHSCGGCELICPAGAVSQKSRCVGKITVGEGRGNVKTVSGLLNLGEPSGDEVISEAIERGFDENAEFTFTDCPPGSGCSVMQCLKNNRFALIVAEPTAFGFCNFLSVCELCRVAGVRFAVVINKYSAPYAPLEDYCSENGIPIIEKIPFDKSLCKKIGRGEIPAKTDKKSAELFDGILKKLIKLAEG